MSSRQCICILMQINMRLDMKSKSPHAYDYFINKNKCIISILIENWYALPKPFIVLSQSASKKRYCFDFIMLEFPCRRTFLAFLHLKLPCMYWSMNVTIMKFLWKKHAVTWDLWWKMLCNICWGPNIQHGHHNIANPLVRLYIEDSVSSWD